MSIGVSFACPDLGRSRTFQRVKPNTVISKTNWKERKNIFNMFLPHTPDAQRPVRRRGTSVNPHVECLGPRSTKTKISEAQALDQYIESGNRQYILRTVAKAAIVKPIEELVVTMKTAIMYWTILSEDFGGLWTWSSSPSLRFDHSPITATLPSRQAL